MGDLQKALERGEYIPLRAPVFESNFIQVNKRGESIYLHNRPNYVTMGICASSPELHLPNVMLLAHSTPPSSQENISTRPARSKHVGSEDKLVLTRYLSLKLVDLSVHSVEERRLKLRLVNGCAYYLELCAPPEKQARLFHQWMQLIDRLKSHSPYQEFENQQENRAIMNTTLKENKKSKGTAINQHAKKEPTKKQLIKKASSKHVTISDIVIPIEKVRDTQSQPYVSMKKTSVQSKKQDVCSKELSKKTVTKSKSRERGFFSISEKRLQTSGILKIVSKTGIPYYK
ncbi:Golgi-associated RAB2 interactor protein 2 [Anolis sagrei]|uniref:Golgi-associated RAB2 interactor protein 2 n=1 Tax=Anolis sagrei TaxID=38937 RepID=UPI003521C51B